ncbi:MAG: hypothetical protein JWN96_2546, partial [Mycobacterium sp.]|nr:hypothetical protein [Mycobacterium sp.]
MVSGLTLPARLLVSYGVVALFLVFAIRAAV